MESREVVIVQGHCREKLNIIGRTFFKVSRAGIWKLVGSSVELPFFPIANASPWCAIKCQGQINVRRGEANENSHPRHSFASILGGNFPVFCWWMGEKRNLFFSPPKTPSKVHQTRLGVKKEGEGSSVMLFSMLRTFKLFFFFNVSASSKCDSMEILLAEVMDLSNENSSKNKSFPFNHTTAFFCVELRPSDDDYTHMFIANLYCHVHIIGLHTFYVCRSLSLLCKRVPWTRDMKS